MNNFEYFPINWVEGMHINASHFINTENFLLERIIKATSIAFSGQYGILPNSNFSVSNFKIENVGSKTQIHLKTYYGICPNGFPILIDEKNNTDKLNSCTCSGRYKLLPQTTPRRATSCPKSIY